MFSSRLPWELRPNRLARLLEQKRREQCPLLDLTESNPTRAGIRYPEPDILRALAQPQALLYEPSPAGLWTAREAVADYYAAKGCRIGPEWIVLTAGTSEAYSLLFKLLADTGEEILVPRPSYPLFDFLAGLESLRPVSYSLRYHGSWSIDRDSLAGAVTPRARAVVLVNPNNPTGSFAKQSEMASLLPFCAEKNLAVLSDEVFSDYAFAPDPDRVVSLASENRALTFCLGGLSKAAGLPQMKLGWIAIAGPAALREAARARLELIADTYLSVGAPVQHALPQLLRLGSQIAEQIQERVRDNWRRLQAAVEGGSACSLLPAEGGWYGILQLPRTRSEEQWCLDLLEQDQVLVQPGYFYDFESEAYLVVSLLTPPGDFAAGLARLLARVRAAA
ncbi:MAG TPA: pyridoxal phosphate-dependent aminotransferase [Terriglobia bacterium]|nr:pyridoxal phosphate-dependent aminotransferase [Terriglobia bacterium]